MNEPLASDRPPGFAGFTILGVAHIAIGCMWVIGVFELQMYTSLIEEYPTTGAIALALSLLQIVAGTGLVRQERWARAVGQLWAALALVTVAAACFGMRDELRADGSHYSTKVVAAGMLVCAVFLAYPIASIIVVARAKRR
jgi:hypothetical protein